jgi:hypothetical protein
VERLPNLGVSPLKFTYGPVAIGDLLCDLDSSLGTNVGE